MNREHLNIGSRDLPPDIPWRQSIFLDTNIWIDIADGVRPDWAEIGHRLIELVENGRAFCPVSAPILWELCKQEYDSALRTAELMDKLSLGVTFIPASEIFRLEARNFFLGIVDNRQYALARHAPFAPFVGHVSTESWIEFPDCWTKDQRQIIVDAVAQQLPKFGVVDLVRWRKDKLPQGVHETPPRFSEAYKGRRKIAGKSKKKARLIEAQAVFEDTVIPEMKGVTKWLPLETVARLQRLVDELPADKSGRRIDVVLEAMPAISNKVDIHTIAGFNVRRKDRMSDFYDIEIMVVPLAYSDVFVSQDKWMRDLLSPQNGLAERNSTEFVSDVQGARSVLRQIEKSEAI